MRRETLVRIRKVLENVASADETRWYLCHVKITPVHLIATDGHILVKVKHGDDGLAAIGPEAFISRERLGYIKAILSKCKTDYSFGAALPVVSEGSIVVDGVTITCKATDFKYPDTDRLMPKTSAANKVVAFNVELLLKLMKGLSDKKVLNCKLEIGDPMAPIRVTSASGDSGDDIGVLMPVRLGK